MGTNQSKKNMKNLKTRILFFLVLSFAATGMSAENKLYPIVKKIKGQVWSIDKNNKNLEISQGYEHTIPYAYMYNTAELPEIIKAKYNL